MACAAVAAVRAGRKAQELVEHDTEISYLANSERQLAIERLLIRFGEALKSIPNQRLSIPTEVVLTPEDGLPDTCAANFDTLQTVPKGNIGDRISHLTTRKMKEAAKAISFALGFDAD